MRSADEIRPDTHSCQTFILKPRQLMWPEIGQFAGNRQPTSRMLYPFPRHVRLRQVLLPGYFRFITTHARLHLSPSRIPEKCFDLFRDVLPFRPGLLPSCDVMPAPAQRMPHQETPRDPDANPERCRHTYP